MKHETKICVHNILILVAIFRYPDPSFAILINIYKLVVFDIRYIIEPCHISSDTHVQEERVTYRQFQH
jgi:hypothetical protein